MVIRISAFVVLLFCVLFAPWWVSLIVSIFCIAYFSFYLEGALLLLLSDLLYGTSEGRYFDITLISFFLVLIFIALAEFLKKKIRITPHNKLL